MHYMNREEQMTGSFSNSKEKLGSSVDQQVAQLEVWVCSDGGLIIYDKKT